MKPFILLLAAATAATAAPAAEPQAIGATRSAYDIICTSPPRGNKVKHGDITWALQNRRKELDLGAGWWNQRNLICDNNNPTPLGQAAVWITYNHVRDKGKETTLAGNARIACRPSEDWGLSCRDA
ncbi:hypothetical protein B0J12DRAFT_669977 [Macrophomina phaseolina]|nr:hypothetical protein B0J12DRAFT_669977 [Macrophomina phaseolina]